MTVRGVFAGVLGLALLQAVVSTGEAADRTGAVLTWIAGFVKRVLDPNVPAIPDLRERAPEQPKSSSGGGGLQSTRPQPPVRI